MGPSSPGRDRMNRSASITSRTLPSTRCCGDVRAEAQERPRPMLDSMFGVRDADAPDGGDAATVAIPDVATSYDADPARFDSSAGRGRDRVEHALHLGRRRPTDAGGTLGKCGGGGDKNRGRDSAAQRLQSQSIQTANFWPIASSTSSRNSSRWTGGMPARVSLSSRVRSWIRKRDTQTPASARGLSGPYTKFPALVLKTSASESSSSCSRPTGSSSAACP